MVGATKDAPIKKQCPPRADLCFTLYVYSGFEEEKKNIFFI